MKHIVVSVIWIVLLSFTLLPCSAEDYEWENIAPYQQKVMQTGFRLLNGSLYEKRITFFFENSVTPKVKLNTRAKRVTVTKGVLPFVDNDDELAAVLSMGIAHMEDYHDGFFRRFSMSFSPRKYEVRADKKAVDIMVKAGYNPIGLINILTKTDRENSWFEYNIYHHNGSERSVYLYQYIYEKYPMYLAQNEYLSDYSYQNFLRTTKQERKKVRLLQKQKLSKQESKKKK